MSISRIIEEDRAKARAYLAEIQIRPALAGTPAEKISVAREFVQNSKVGSAALRVWHATLHYHGWSKRDDFQKWNDLGVSEILEQPEFPPRSTGFRWGDRSWIFSLERTGRSFSGDNNLGRFRVTVDGELVMELAVAGFHREWGEEWYQTDVSALTVGPWAGTLVDMWAELELAKLRRRAETETARVEEQASRINLG